MNYTHKSLCAVLISVSISACQSANTDRVIGDENDFPYQINLEVAEQEKAEVLLSEFAENISYIPLETTEESLVGRNSYMYLTEEHLLTTAFRQIFLFDKKTGQFIREISNYGQGPDEYRNTYPQLHFNEEDQVTYVRGNNQKALGLDVEGNKRSEFQFPMDDNTLVNGFIKVGTDLYAGFHSNYDCKQEDKLIVFNPEGEVVNTFKNHLICINTAPNSINFNSTEGTFHHWNNRAFFKETYNDTLFQVNADSLIPQAIFNSGEHALKYEDKISLVFDKNAHPYFQISRIDQTQHHLFFKLAYKGKSYDAFYDKQNGVTKVASQPGAESSRFTNDLDDFIPFSVNYATADGKLVGYLEAPEVIEWFEANPEKAAKLPPHLKRLADMREDDNPIVMIVSLKD